MAKQHSIPFRLFKRGEIYHAYISFVTETGDRVQLRETTGRTSEYEATQYCLKRIKDIQDKAHRQETGELQQITIDEAFAKYYVEKGQYLTLPNQRLTRLNILKESLKVKYLSDISEENINHFITTHRQDFTNSTINRYLALLSVVLNTAENEWKVKTPHIKISHFKLKEPAENIKCLKDWETAQKIIDNASPHLKPIIYTALYTGLRRANILGLKWENIDFKSNTITLKVKDRTKLGGKVHTIPMIEQLAEILKQQPKINEYVFNFRGKKIDSIARSWHFIFYKYVPTKKIEQGDVIEYRLVKGEKIPYKRVLRDETLPYTNFHTLRHTAATWILKKTNNLRITKEILGHADIKTTLKYAHVMDEEKRQALNMVFAQNLHKSDTAKN